MWVNLQDLLLILSLYYLESTVYHLFHSFDKLNHILNIGTIFQYVSSLRFEFFINLWFYPQSELFHYSDLLHKRREMKGLLKCKKCSLLTGSSTVCLERGPVFVFEDVQNGNHTIFFKNGITGFRGYESSFRIDFVVRRLKLHVCLVTPRTTLTSTLQTVRKKKTNKKRWNVNIFTVL